jgi:diguanylate cyclase (GGDEF)-like protein/PAS domain S-box-containing protein
MSFRIKTILGIAAIEALLLALLIGSVLDYLRDSNEHQLLDRVSTTTTLFAATAKDAVIANDLASLESLVNEVMNLPNMVYLRVLNVDGRVLAQQGEIGALERPFIVDHSVQEVTDSTFDAQSTIEVAGIIFGRVELGMDVRSLQTVLNDARLHSLWIAAAEMILVALFSFFFGLYLTRQLSALTRASQAVEAGELGYQVPILGRDELAETAAAFNRMSLQLKEDVARRDAVLNTALDCIVTADGQGNITEFNPAAENAFGYLREEVIGRSLTEMLIPERFHEAHRQGMLHYAETGGLRLSGQRIEAYARRADGSEFPVEVAITVTKVGAHPLFLSYLRDISERREAEEQLRKFSRAVEQSPASVVITDLDGTIEFVNTKFVEVTGYTAEEAIGQNPRILKTELTPPERHKELWDTLSSGSEWHGELVNRKKNGDIYWEWCSISPVRRPNGIITHYLAVKEEITTRKRAEEKLQLAANVFSYAREGIMITAPDGTIIDVNDAFTRITGYNRDEALGQNPRILNSGHQEKAYYAAMWRDLIENGHWSGEVWNLHKNGEVYVEMLTISAVRDKQGKTTHYVALFSDITAQKEHQQQLEHIAHYDALTGLPNRVLLADRLHQSMLQANRHGQQLLVAFIDLDGFKAINDTHGHDIGDKLLITVATRMKQSLREGDTVSRLGGDEFVAVLNELADIKAGVPMLARLLAATAQPVHVKDLTLQVSASIGVTLYPQTNEIDADQLLRQADQAMYQAKLAGKNRYHLFDAEHDRNVRSHHESLDRIHLALADHEFELYYQPKVNMRTGEVFGAEALIRWQHPEQGLLLPAVFLPVIEAHPLFIELGEWVITTALLQLEAWHTAGLNISVSVNVGALQLQQSDFTDRLRTLLALHPTIDPVYLELEILETSALEDMEHISQVMQRCREIGVNFSLDDFGTGYSSLTYLKRLPATQLKVDRSFVRDMLDDPEDLAILEGIMGLATAFRRQVIAEGVETLAHGEMLLQLGCELAQGYGIARPMPAPIFMDWAAAWQPAPSWANQRPVSRDDLPLLFAGVEHRAWIRAIEDFLKGERTEPPPMDHHQCRFGHWMDDEGQARHGAHPAFPSIKALHQQVHALVAELLEHHDQGQNLEALAKMDELYDLRDALLRQLQILVQEDR